ncbi:MAG: hypothetical protein QW165_01985 [Candidatus Woesearchaeota archaeon]
MKHTPRIIGGLLIIIAALAYFSKLQGWIGLGIAGIVLLAAKEAYTQKMLDTAITALARWKTLFTTALCDALYWLFVFGAVYFFQWRLQAKATAAQTAGFVNKEALANPEIAAQSLASLQGFVSYLYIGLLVLFALVFIAYVLSRGYIWTTIARQKADKKFFGQWALLNLGWWAIWLPIFIFMLIGTKNYGTQIAGASIALILGVAAYFTAIMHTLYMQTRKKGYSIANGLGWGLSKLHLLIVPYTYAFVIYIVLYQIFRLFQTTAIMRPISMLFVVLFIAWLRIYLYHVIKQFKQY